MNFDLFSAANEDGESDVRSAARGAREVGPAADPAATGRTYSVSDVNGLAREVLETAFPPLWVGGEVANWKRHTSGHCYFSLRDDSAQIPCVMFRSDARRLPTDPEAGMEVRALGTLTIYEARGTFQVVVRELEAVAGGGLWRLAFERLRETLDREGLLAPERKRPLPSMPRVVGVVTSPVGAALHDVLTVIQRRAPWTRVVLAPARVQGDGAAEEIARAIRRFDRAGVADVLIVGRGGGSVEDLWAFNEEVVARAIAEASVPVISAVGHETDVTIADLVADCRAPTPSAAAECAVPDRAAIGERLDALSHRMEDALRHRVAERRGQTMLLRDALEAGVREVIDSRRERLLRAASTLEALSPLSALRRGYAVPLAGDGRVLRRRAEFRTGDPLRLRVVDGTVACRVEESAPDVEEAKEHV